MEACGITSESNLRLTKSWDWQGPGEVIVFKAGILRCGEVYISKSHSCNNATTYTLYHLVINFIKKKKKNSLETSICILMTTS